MATPDGARAQNPEGVADDEPAQVAAAAVPDGDELGARRTQSSERFVDAKAGDAIASLLAVDPADREHELTRIERDAVARRRDQAALRLGLPATLDGRDQLGHARQRLDVGIAENDERCHGGNLRRGPPLVHRCRGPSESFTAAQPWSPEAPLAGLRRRPILAR
jgi:hypothetical protein